MRHLKSGRKLKRTWSHRKALLANLASALIQHKRIETTEAKAKELRPYVEKIITRAKRAVLSEKNGSLGSNQTIDIHSRREVARLLTNKAIIQELFDSVAPVVESRNGGYTRIIKTGVRQGDAGRKAIIELVDWSEQQDGKASLGKKRTASTARVVRQVEKAVAAVAETVAQEEDKA
jgi:large subunit ribosomal protein L17